MPQSPLLAPLLSQRRFQPPEDWDWGFYTIDSLKIRYGQSRSRKTYDAVGVILGGLGDFGEQYFELANEMESRNIKPIIIDMPGQGGSSRYLPDTPMKRHSQGFDRLLKQLHAVFTDIVVSTAIDSDDNHKRLPIFLVAHSMGGHIALRYLTDYNKTTRGQTIFCFTALSAPMMGIRAVDAVPRFMRRIILRLLALCPTAYVPGGCDWFDGYRERAGFKGIFSSDPERYELQRIYFSSPDTSFLAVGSPTNQWLWDAYTSCERFKESGYLEKIDIPVLFAIAGEDALVTNAATRAAADRIKTSQIIELQGAQHEIIMESNQYRTPFVDRIFTFVTENVLNRSDKGKTYIQ